ncbi:MAG: hypothetical protein AAGA55_12125, partial [Planctomycetota bacterium]
MFAPTLRFGINENSSVYSGIGVAASYLNNSNDPIFATDGTLILGLEQALNDSIKLIAEGAGG